MDDCILSSLSLPLGAKSESRSCSPAPKDSNHQERTGRPDSPEAGQQQRDANQRLRPRRASQERRKSAGAAPWEDTIDLTAFNEHADSNSGDGDDADSNTSLRKRKLPLGGGDVPAKRPTELPAFL